MIEDTISPEDHRTFGDDYFPWGWCLPFSVFWGVAIRKFCLLIFWRINND